MNKEDESLKWLQEMSHQELWNCYAIAKKDKSVWQIVALNQKRDKIHVKYLFGTTKIGEFDLEGNRVATFSPDDIAKLDKELEF